MRILLFLFAGSVVFGQLESNTVTVAATRSVSVQPDQAVFSEAVVTPASASLEDAVAALQGSGITAAQFAGLASPIQLFTVTGAIGTTPPHQLQWTFSVPEPLAKVKDTTAMLVAIQKSIAQRGNGFALSYTRAGAQSSQQLQAAQQCPVSDLIADARAKAQTIAAAAGLTLGSILAVSSANSTGALGGVVSASVPSLAFRSGGFTPAGGVGYASFIIGGLSPTLPPVQPVTCYLTVKFGVTRY